MRVVVTRPAREARPWAEALRAHGHEVLELPLIDIAPVADAPPLHAAVEQAAAYRAVMFVSPNAVHGWQAASSRPWPAGTSAWAPGPGTVAALQAIGVPPSQVAAPPADAAQFDSEALWAVVRGSVHAGDRVLLVRGADADGLPAGRDWLADTLRGAGVLVETVAAYSRRPPAWTDVQRSQARDAAADGSIWLFSSSQAIEHLRALLPGQDWSRARAVATHERIAQAARALGFPVVSLSRPDRDAVVRALESSG